MEIKKIKDWGISISNERPMVISGPCSAETKEQVLATARRLKGQGINIFRAGIWKPRTRPNSFDGVGIKGLPWLKKVKEETGMLVSTEVANASHVINSIKFGIDIIWIGARTTANPFAVQDIADVLKNYDIPVFIKNPVNPDIELWIGAIERIAQVGISRIGAIHRGFSAYENTIYRNVPQWQIPIELRRRIKNIPILCDPSHISGKKDLIFDISQKAMDLNYDGLIIESHINPSKAWSDASQQLTPSELKIMLDKLILRNVSAENFEDKIILDELRQEIDLLDHKLFEIFEQRMDKVKKIGKYKKDHNITIFQPERWNKVLEKAIEKGLDKKFSQEFIIKIFKAIHQESINKQTSIMNK